MTAVIQGAASDQRRKKTRRGGERENVRKREQGRISTSTIRNGEEISSEKRCSMSEEGREEDKESK